MLVLPWDAAGADPQRGREDPPGREKKQADAEQDDRSESSDGASDNGSPREDARERRPGERSAESDPPSQRGRRSQTSDPEQAQESRQPEDEAEGSDERAVVAADVRLSVSAAPPRIAPGDTSTIRAVVSVPEGAAVDHAEVLVDLPDHLTFRSASHPVSATRRTLRLELGELLPGTQTTVEVVVEGLAHVGATAPVRIAVTADATVVRDEVGIVVSGESENALALSQSGPLLVQVGDTGSFSITLRNASERVVEDAIVVAEMAPELDVVGVTPIAEADAIQLGRSRAREDVVWVFETLAPGQEIELTWSAQVVTAGDLEATVAAEASAAQTPKTTSAQTTYLGYVLGVRTSAGDATTTPAVQERVVTKLVPVTREVSGAAAAQLPVTGATPADAVLVAVALIALGCAFLLFAGGTAARRASAVAALTVVLTASACVSDPGAGSNQQAAEPSVTAGSQDVPHEGDEEDEKDEEAEDRVLGLRIERDEPESGAPSDPVAPTEAAEPQVPVTTEVVFEEVTTIERVTVAQTPPRALASRVGDNQVSVQVGAGAPTITSSRTISADQLEELLVSARGAGSALEATVTLRNLADHALVVRGVLVLEIASAAGTASELTSDTVDAVIQPGGEISARFSFSLPAGGYGLTGTFRAY